MQLLALRFLNFRLLYFFKNVLSPTKQTLDLAYINGNPGQLTTGLNFKTRGLAFFFFVIQLINKS